MNTQKIVKLSALSALFGILFYAVNRGWIIINAPFTASQSQTQPNRMPETPQKKVTLFFWHRNAWHQEATRLVWSEYNGQNAAYLINSWLSLLDDEKITCKKVSLQTAMLNAAGTELYISFDRSLFSKDATTHEKWMLIEGLLKTLRQNGITPQTVRFLIHHQLFNDMHLDFNSPWPIHGFIN